MSKTNQQRQNWMSVLAKAPTESLMALSEPVMNDASFEVIRQPEIGLTQIRARMGGEGNPFNLGDMTMTRCVVRSNMNTLGYGYISGRKKSHALRAAQMDALLQSSEFESLLLERVIEPLQRQIQQQELVQKREVDATRVDFFTLVRGED
ncbi:phosphonate C-P lyase system protein PhnG [Aestuariirhabdus sp. Z084]|uniref:phosphonate C-P lyase system protein PhnG n=1 Tax=Aestuariirhabdus haliotis TaxID=2918751 RepID=UPI00201B39C3|nr:phosphonate C-P lyase system protein PhnG [Aestuariirhabdus haliotis]MCL6416007.1 phosphonate C-P lyase system protein PhnG [Aestuariirhabdus haliotis]MCL6419960.1 phosphonate C-P lyase system protein PhnG [Aestuariirhabdus haliotis]